MTFIAETFPRAVATFGFGYLALALLAAAMP
jgi:hypothetical protein